MEAPSRPPPRGRGRYGGLLVWCFDVLSWLPLRGEEAFPRGFSKRTPPPLGEVGRGLMVMLRGIAHGTMWEVVMCCVNSPAWAGLSVHAAACAIAAACDGQRSGMRCPTHQPPPRGSSPLGEAGRGLTRRRVARSTTAPARGRAAWTGAPPSSLDARAGGA